MSGFAAEAEGIRQNSTGGSLRILLVLPFGVALVLALPGALQSQAVSPDLRAALMAQVQGRPGGCWNLEHVAPLQVPYFPAVQFVQGECTLEHGHIARPIAAVDSSGQVYVLDSQSAFHYLVRRHPPVGLDSLSAVEYTRLALVLTGQLPADAQVMLDKRQVPKSLTARVDLDHDGLIPSRVDRWVPDRRGVVQVTAFTDSAVYSSGPALVSATGEVIAAVTEWSENGRRVK